MTNLPSIFKKFVFGRNVLLPLLFFVLTFFLFVVPVLAVSSQTISANPTNPSPSDPRSKSWFIYSLPAGVTKKDTVTVENNSNQPITLKVYAADSLKTSQGGFALANEDAAKKGLGSWVKLSVAEVTLGPNEERNIPFTISIPAQTPTGEYSGGIIFQETQPQKFTGGNGVGINVISRVGVRIYETVPGVNQLSLAVKDFRYSVADNNLIFSFTVENKGTVFISPTGTLEVKDMIGQVISDIPLDNILGVVIPGVPRTIVVPTQIASPIFGWNTASVALYYSPTKTAMASIVFMPNLWPLYIIVFLIVLFVLYLLLRKKLVGAKGKLLTNKPSAKVLLGVGAILLGTVIFSYLIVYLFGLLLTK